jgi:hypothetical protein
MSDNLTLFQNRLRSSRNISEPNWQRGMDNYKHYLGRLDVGGMSEEDYPYQSNMTVPISYEIVETVLPRYIGRDPEFTTIAVEPTDAPFEATSKMAIEMAYENPKLEMLGEPIYLKLYKMVKEGLITGNFVGRPFWRREARKRISYLANLEELGIENDKDIKKVLDLSEKIKKEGGRGQVTWSKKLIDTPFLDDFDIRHIPFFHFFGDLAFDMPGRMRYKIEREYMTFEELADEATIFGYDKVAMEEVAALVHGGKSGFSSEIGKDFLQDYQNLFSNAVHPQALSTDDTKIPLLLVDKMWTGDRVSVFVNEKYNLTGDTGIRNPYDVMVDPFIFGQDVVMPHSYFAWGEIDAIRKLEDGITDVLNMRFDNLLQSMLNYWLYNPKFTSGEQFVPVPNSVTAVGDIDRAAKMISGKDVTGSAYKEAEELIGIVQRVTGVNDYVKGSEGETLAGRTYGGLRLVQEMANARFIVKSRLFEKLTLKALGYFMLEMSRQFINKDRVRRMSGDDDSTVENELKAGELKQIKGFMDIKVIPNSSRVIDEQAEAMKLNAVADRFISDKGPFQNIPPEVFDKFLLLYLQRYGIHDAYYWVRAIREHRAKMAKNPAQPAASGGADLAEAMAGGGITQPIVQSDRVANQVSPIEQINTAETMPPDINQMLGQM